MADGAATAVWVAWLQHLVNGQIERKSAMVQIWGRQQRKAMKQMSARNIAIAIATVACGVLLSFS